MTHEVDPVLAGGIAKATAAKYEKAPACRGAVARFPRALREVAKVSAYGIVKHESSWDKSMAYLDVPNAYGVYSDALVRHLEEEAIEGFVNSRDGNLLHAAQTAWNSLARLEWLLRSGVRGGSLGSREPNIIDPDPEC